MRMRLVALCFAAALLCGALGCDSPREPAGIPVDGQKIRPVRPGLWVKVQRGHAPSKKEQTALSLATMNAQVGREEMQKGRYGAAVGRFDRALRILPDYIDVYVDLGRVYLEMGKHALALTTFRQARASLLSYRLQSPDADRLLASIERALGDVHRASGETAKAIRAYQRVLQLVPINAGAHFALGELYLEEKNFEDAIYRFSQALEIDVYFNQALLKRAIAYYLSGRPEKAWADIEELDRRTIEVHPDFKRQVLTELRRRHEAGAGRR